MSRRPDLRVARFADVQLVTLALADEQRAREFVARTLGELAGAEPELRDTSCVYIGEQFSAARAARVLYTHRNTVLNRLQRAERLLPFPLAGHGLEVGVASRSPSGWGPNPAVPPIPGDARTPRRREPRTQRARDAVGPGLPVAAGATSIGSRRP